MERLLHYTFFTEQGLTIHDRGIDALLRFMTVRAELFRSIYFHRTVRAIDVTLADLFVESKAYLFPGNPIHRLDEYLGFTESSLLVDVSRWPKSGDPVQRELGLRWQELLRRQVPWKMVCQRTLVFSERDPERSSIFTDAKLVEQKLRSSFQNPLDNVPIRVDIDRHIFRPHTSGPMPGQNFLYDSAQNRVRPLSTNQLFERLPVSQRICRVYAQNNVHSAALSAALDAA